MRSLLRWLLACCTLGAVAAGCGKSEVPAGPADVILRVPGMY
jgi:hypothetical protein